MKKKALLISIAVIMVILLIGGVCIRPKTLYDRVFKKYDDRGYTYIVLVEKQIYSDDGTLTSRHAELTEKQITELMKLLKKTCYTRGYSYNPYTYDRTKKSLANRSYYAISPIPIDKNGERLTKGGIYGGITIYYETGDIYIGMFENRGMFGSGYCHASEYWDGATSLQLIGRSFFDNLDGIAGFK